MFEVLLADDEPSIRLTVGDALKGAGYAVTLAADGAEAMRCIESRPFDLVISDIRIPKVDGLTIFKNVRQIAPHTDIVLITAFGEVADAVMALRGGAHDYLTKPFDIDELLVRIQRLAERRAMQGELENARLALAKQGSSALIVGQSPVMLQLTKRLETVASSDVSVVVTGESGTGKELVARTLHTLSPRRDRPFVAVNCAAFPETLIEAELFGHERGAFTGAVKRRDGRFKAADGGTLFLDEIGEIPAMVQAKLLRVLQEGVIEPLGTNQGIKVDVRIVCATHRNLKELISSGRFREDLYYRLNVLDLHVPALRDRRGDLPLLVEYFLRKFGKADAQPPSIAPRAWAALSHYGFPGNVRELEHAMRHAVVLAAGREIDLEHLPADIAGAAPRAETHDSSIIRPLATAAKEFEREYLLRVLQITKGKRAVAADLLGISRKNLWEKLRAHGVSDEELAESPQEAEA
jgi:DNA-binding NtrC family response regulator